MENGLVFDIKKYSVHDGPGIRLTIFFKGCPLSCLWCHNPEGISCKPQKIYSRVKCIGCQKCIGACNNNAIMFTGNGILTNYNNCVACGNCANVCPAKATEMVGSNFTTNQLMQVIEREVVFFDKSGGGVTFSGGEPIMQPRILIELLNNCAQKRIHTVVDTTLFAPTNLVLDIAKLTNLFLVDLKAFDTVVHKKYTGVNNDIILKNISELAKNNHDFIIRIPFIDGVNSDEKTITAEAAFLSKLPWERRQVELLPYHNIANNKVIKLGSNINQVVFSTPTNKVVQNAISIFAKHGINATVNA